jgi:outer membrane protein assembly factor BamC
VSPLKAFYVKFSVSYLRFFWFATSLLALSACGTLSSSENMDYKSEVTKKPVALDIPPDLSQLNRDSRYVLPSSSVSASSMPGNNLSAISTATQKLNDARIEREGQQRWIVVNRRVEEIWPIVHDFWIGKGFTYVFEDQSLGILETEWAEDRGKLPQDFIRRNLGKIANVLTDSGYRDKFRTRLERNIRGEVEIYVTHRGLSEEYKDAFKTATGWKPRPSEPELEIEFMKLLMLKIGNSQPTPKIDTVNIVSNLPITRAEVVKIDGIPNIAISESFDVAWRRIGLALDRTGFTVEDRDRLQGTYFVRFVDTSPDERGFFTRMFSKSKAEAGPVKYRLKILGVETKTLVSIQNANGQSENSASTQRIMKLLVDDLK